MASVVKCGVCMADIEETNIYKHICVKDLHSVTYSSDSKIFYPTNQKGEYLATVTCNNKKQIMLLKNVSTPSSSNETEMFKLFENDVVETENIDCELEELLIEEVKKRPPIYDYILPLSVRGRYKIIDLWKEISESLNGQMSPEEAKKKWKSLKDTFSKIVADEKKPSGSARSSSKKPWKYLELMSFLHSVSTNRKSISNITINEAITDKDTTNEFNNNLFENNDSNNFEEHENESLAKRPTKKNDLSTSMNRIVDALCNKETPVINLPKLPEITALDGMFIYIKERLQKLPSEKQDTLLLKFLQDIIKEEENMRR